MRTLFIEDRREIEKIIKSCKTCYLAMSENDVPYVVPMNFALDGGSVILHSAQEGRKWKTMRKNPKVCINWTLGEELAWQDVQVGCSYRVKSRTVLAEGEAEIIDDYDEKYELLKSLMGQYSDREFKFNVPAVKNVGVIKVKIEKLTAKEFGAKAVTPRNS
jgi:nitroimidazol reductase NimA-like FMN-containing flavoprotein (pyridoxamine 5'-phosphate oxidase superfamily)